MKIRTQAGAVLATVALTIAVILATVALAVDGGVLYIARSEAQSYADAAALAAASKLDGTSTGIAAAKTAALGTTWKRWMFNTQTFATSDVQIRFCTTLMCDGGGEENPSGVGIRSVWVWASAQVPVYFMPVAGFSSSQPVSAAAVAAQATMVSANEGLFPFVVAARGAAPSYGFTKNLAYTFRWHVDAGGQLMDAIRDYQALNTTIQNLLQITYGWCSGDTTPDFVNAVLVEMGYTEEQVQAATGADYRAMRSAFNDLFQDKGFYLVGSQSEMKAGIEYGYQTQSVTVGDILDAASGMKTGMADSIITRVARDTNVELRTDGGMVAGADVDYYFVPPDSSGVVGSGDRLVIVPVLGMSSLVAGIGTPVQGFLPFLLEADGTNNPKKNDFYDGSATPHKPWCFSYVESVVGSTGDQGYAPGVFVLRLVK